MIWKKLIIILIILLIGAYFAFSRGVVGPKRPFIQDSTYCEIDTDCTLYNCTSCGNNFWIDQKDVTSNDNCQISVPGLVGCKCVESVCKRDYGK